MSPAGLRERLPGYVATGLTMLTTALWVFWGVAEMFYEGWGLPFPAPAEYLVPGTVCLGLTLAALTWPRAGGWVILVIGGAFTLWWWGMMASRGVLTVRGALSVTPASAVMLVTGVLFLAEARYRERRPLEEWAPRTTGTVASGASRATASC